MATLREKIPLRRRKILKKSFTKLVITSVVVAVAWFIYGPFMDVLSQDNPAIAANRKIIDASFAGICAVLLLASPFYQYLYFRTYFYDIDDQNVIIRKGVLKKKEITMPFTKITDVYVDRDLGDVVLGLYDLYLSTPTSESGLFAHIDGLNREGSAEIRRLILERISKLSAAARQ